MLLLLLIFAVSFVLVAFVSGNNLSACAGGIVGSRIVSRRSGVTIAALGYIAGFLAQGHMLKAGIEALMPYKPELLVLDALAIATAIFIIAHKARVPQSLSMSFASIVLGISVAEGSSISILYLAKMFLFWVLAPVAAFAIAIILMRLLKRSVNKRRIWDTVRNLKLVSIISAFFTAFTLGANTIGFMYASIPESAYSVLLVIIAILVGSYALSAAELRRIGNEIIPIRYMSSVSTQVSSLLVVEAATLFSVPLSNTQAFTAGVYGTGMSYEHRLMLRRPLLTIVGTWIGIAALGFILAYASAAVLV
ncbi:MAG: inorganic phosphate transporter [Candidatus Micrarchaeia archaeon]